MNIAIVPVLINLSMTKRCVESVLEQDITTTLYIIDNGSTDGCGPYLRSLGTLMQTYTRPRALSLVWNRALSFVFDDLKLEHALVVNNDVILRPDTYRLLLAHGGPFVTAVGVHTMAQMTEAVPTMDTRPHPDFSAYLIRRSVWYSVGPFDESITCFYGDNDYHIRMQRAGIEAVSINLPFFHESSGTIKSAPPELRDSIMRQADRDRAAFQAKYGCLPGTPEYEALFK